MQNEQVINIGLLQLKGKLEPVNIYGLVWDASNPDLGKRYLERQKQTLPASETPKPAKINISGLPELEEKELKPQGQPSNPFLNRSAITQSDYFCGREVLIHKIYSRLSAVRPQSISLYGERRIGKSSLLNQLGSYCLRKRFLQDMQHNIFINIDIQSMRSATVEHFIETLYDGIKSCFSGNLSFDLKPTYHDFTRLVTELCEAGFALIIMFDEFDLITLNPNFDVEFYSWLRNLASHQRLAFVTSSFSQLQQLCATKKISDSPFFNIFTAYYVGPFSPEEVKTMIDKLLELSLTDLSFDRWLPEITDKAGYLPFFIQIYCSNLFDLYSSQPSPAEVEAAFLEEAADHFEHICRNFSDMEQECIQLILAKRKLPAKLDSTLQALLRKGYVTQSEAGVRLFSRTFEGYYQKRESSLKPKSLWSKLWKT